MKISQERAKPFYSTGLPYHNWSHAEEVMHRAEQLVNTKGGRWTRQVNRPLLQIAAAWHDAGYDDDGRFQHESPEHYSAYLMREYLKDELNPRQLAVVRESILGTRFKAPRDTMATVALHYADVGNMADEYENFYDHTVTLWREEGAKDWETWRTKALGVLAVVTEESVRELPYIGVDGRDFSERVQHNAERLAGESARV